MPPSLEKQFLQYPPAYEASANECLPRIKCVLVGDGAVGKTSLIIGYTTKAYPKEYMPTAYDKYTVVVNVNNQPLRLQICDTAGQDDFDALRPLCYQHTDVFLLCFSVVYPTSFYNIAEKWIYEVRHYNPKVPVVLVGTQRDLRFDMRTMLELAEYKEQPVTEDQAKALASRIGAVAYMECSAVTPWNLKEVFDTALLAALRTPKFDFLGVSGKGNSEEVEGRRRRRGWKKLWCFS